MRIHLYCAYTLNIGLAHNAIFFLLCLTLNPHSYIFAFLTSFLDVARGQSKLYLQILRTYAACNCDPSSLFLLFLRFLLFLLFLLSLLFLYRPLYPRPHKRSSTRQQESKSIMDQTPVINNSKLTQSLQLPRCTITNWTWILLNLLTSRNYGRDKMTAGRGRENELRCYS